MASSNPGPSMTDETNQQQSVSMPSLDTLRLENLASVREPCDTIDDKTFERFSFHSSNVIGRGYYSAVFKGTFLSNKEVAIKRMQKIDAEIAENEYEKLMELSHTNVIKNMHIEDDNDYIYIVLELCHTNLNDMVIENKIDDYAFKVNILHGIASGLDYLHSKGIIHRDLKPSNILMKQNSVTKDITPKIADFGISRIIAVGRNHYTATDGTLGSPIWRAPEVLNDTNLHITTAVDMFAYGCIVHFVMCPVSQPQLRHPFGVLKGNIGGDNIMLAIKAGKRKLYISIIDYKKPKAIDYVKRIFSDILIQDLTNLYPGNRPSIKHVLNFPLFWDTSKQCSFFTDQYNYLNAYHDREFENNCKKFFSHKKLCRLYASPADWNTVAQQLTMAGLPLVPDTIQSTKLFSNTLRVLRNNITHYMENDSHSTISINSLLTRFYKKFPFFFPVLWVTYRYLQIPSRYYKRIKNVKEILDNYYAPLDIDDPNCLVTDLEFVKK